jgi:hypothetical protein
MTWVRSRKRSRAALPSTVFGTIETTSALEPGSQNLHGATVGSTTGPGMSNVLMQHPNGVTEARARCRVSLLALALGTVAAWADPIAIVNANFQTVDQYEYGVDGDIPGFTETSSFAALYDVPGYNVLDLNSPRNYEGNGEAAFIRCRVQHSLLVYINFPVLYKDFTTVNLTNQLTTMPEIPSPAANTLSCT